MMTKLLRTTAQSALARYLVRPATNVLASVLDSRNKLIVNFQEPDRVRILDLVRRIKRERMFLLEGHEAYQLASAVIQTGKVPGDVIEVGVFQGGSAKLICELKNDKRLHLCDTFDGLPQPHTIDVRFAIGSFKCPLESVQQYLAGYQGVRFHQGLFPESAPSLRETKFSLAHLDVDLYSSTLGCLEFLYPRMARGGVIISHDYTTAAGVQRAFDEFFADKLDPVLLLCGSQSLVVKV
jgi:O-methyltransferase